MKLPGIAILAPALLLACAVFSTVDALAEELEALKIEFPEPVHGGTPFDGIVWNPGPDMHKPFPPLLVPKDVDILSIGSKVTASAKPLNGKMKFLTDGKKELKRDNAVELPGERQWIQIDLGQESSLFAIVFWHWHRGKDIVFDVVVQLSNDPKFASGVTTVFNNDHDNSSGLGVGKDYEYFETNKGRAVAANGVSARYVRLYSRGSHFNNSNGYIEAEVWGKLPSRPE